VLPLVEAAKAGRLNGRDMDKNVLAAAFRRNVLRLCSDTI
jgi:hypothetical protein